MICYLTITFCNKDKLCNKFFEADILCFYFVYSEILVGPNFPLKVEINSDHLFVWLKNSEDIDKYFEPYQHLFKEIHDLGERKVIDVYEPTVDILYFG